MRYIKRTDLKIHEKIVGLGFEDPVNYEEMKADIDENGINVSLVITPENYIVCGYIRFKIANELGIEELPCDVREFESEDAMIDFAIKDNLLRRHMNNFQRGLFALKLLEIEKERAKERKEATQLAGRDEEGEPLLKSSVKATLPEPKNDIGQARDIAAKKAGIGGRTLDKIKTIEQKASKEVKQKLHLGETTINKAYNHIKKEEKKEEQMKKITEEALQPTGRYHVIVIDPPWKYDNKRVGDESQRGIVDYADMTFGELQALPVPDLAQDDCILWLWTTNAHIHEALNLMSEWGFTQKTILTWVKHKMGLGRWLRGQTEHCLMGVKGNPHVNLTNQTTALSAKVREHSRKPEEFYDLVDELCTGSRLEMFARTEREGWVSWGDETNKFSPNVQPPNSEAVESKT